MITAPSSTANMFFEKKSFFYWLDDGIVEISLESSKKGKWRTMDNNLSAQGKNFNIHPTSELAYKMKYFSRRKTL